MPAKSPKKRLLDAYRFPGFFLRPLDEVKGVFGDPLVRVVKLVRRSKNALRELRMRAGRLVRPPHAPGARPAVRASFWSSRFAASAARCRAVKREALDWLSDNPFYTKRIAYSAATNRLQPWPGNYTWTGTA